MSKPILRPVLFSAFLLLSLAVLPGRSAAVPTHPFFPNVIGVWSGNWFSANGASGLASLSVPAQQNRRFTGTFVFYPPQPIFPPQPIRVLGTASDSGEVSLVGRNEFAFLEAHGQTDGEVMNLNYLLHFADGSMDFGTTSVSIPTGNGP